jgi:hypothetical protein
MTVCAHFSRTRVLPGLSAFGDPGMGFSELGSIAG